ncbi:radical SAM protein [Candidatus Woesearchaeota archaeon]|nr:radical SAM protein [Candidatus Woesearchaeota archaeon]
MAALTFDSLSFKDKKNSIGIDFLKIFSAEIPKKDLSSIGKFSITKNSIIFDTTQKKAEKKFNFLLAEAFKNLENKLTHKKTIYVHKNSGIPLIGHNSFGLIDRNTSIIEVRCITGCNLDCIYCSVNQNKRPIDFVVEKDYLIEEFRKLIEHKQINNIEAHIGTQGEPLLYEPLPELIEDLASFSEVSDIAIDTNGTFLTKKKVDQLIDAGLTRFCFSINALDKKIAEKISGACQKSSESNFSHMSYNSEHILEIAEYISKQDVELIITPVWIPGVNDKEIPKLIDLSKRLNCNIGIQNFLNYKFGKNPVKQISWKEFIKKMKKFEKEKHTKLLFDFKKDFNIRKTKPLPKPFRKKDIIKAKIIAPGRLKNEMLAVAKKRIISVHNCSLPVNSKVKLKIVREKHNIFSAIAV